MSGVLGLDIGGANLKAAHSDGSAISLGFPLWKQPGQLADGLVKLSGKCPAYETIAVTMTGELCDCFPTKREGVKVILDAVGKAFPEKQIRVWRTDGGFCDSTRARGTPLQTGASNWHALATFAGRFTKGEPAIMIDMGSTTTDVIPLVDGRPMPQGWTDAERLKTGELVYVGLTRTPVCAVLGMEGMAELFATMRDVTLLLGFTPELPDDRDTADGRPATRRFAHGRLARMVGADADSMSMEQAELLAQRILGKVRQAVLESAAKVAGNLAKMPRRFVFAGQGDAVANLFVSHLLGDPALNVFLATELGDEVNRAACAFAVATLAKEMPDA